MVKTDFTENKQILPMSESNSNSLPRCETVKQWLKRRNYRTEFGGYTHHHRLAKALTRVGFIVKTVQREDYHPVWSLSLRPGTVDGWRDYRMIRRLVSQALLELGLQCPAREVTACVTGQVLKVAFLWENGAPGIVTFWSPNRVRAFTEH